MAKKNLRSKQRKNEKNVSPEKMAEKYRNRYIRTSKNLYKSILKCIPKLKEDDGTYNSEAVQLMINTGELFDSLGSMSRKWTFSIHWLYTVCNPNITNVENISYSPLYLKYATEFPNDCFGELKHLDDGAQKLVSHGDKLVADKRFVDAGIWNFGSSWSADGNVNKTDENGHPVFDDFSGWIVDNVTKIQNEYLKKNRRDRRFQAFLIAHTRDLQLNVRNSEPEHKESHFHGVLKLPNLKSRYQIMEAMGVNFKDFEETFDWIATCGFDNANARIQAFLNSLKGLVKNYSIPDYPKSALQYLVHQSSGALKDQKTSYNTKEVISWLPDDSGEDYEHIAGVFNDEVVSKGMRAEIIENLHSVYNMMRHTAHFVGQADEAKMFTFEILEDVRSLGKKQPGKLEFSKRSKDLITKEIMVLIRQHKIEMNDIERLIHAAFNDDDADKILSDKDFNMKLQTILENEIKSILADGDYDRHMLTIFISSKVGGIGKTRLAIELAKLFDKGRMPHQASAKDEDKTFDAYQNYNNESSSVIDEIDAGSISWSQLKDLLDPHKVPTVSSRFRVKIPWNVHKTFITNVYEDGISEYVRRVLHFAPGVSSLGYLIKEDMEWRLKLRDEEAARSYISQLSQLIRRIPVSIYMEPSKDLKGTRVIVSVINFKPSGRNVGKYGYVHTNESDHTFDFVISDGVSKEKLNYFVKTVAKMIKDIQLKAKKSFEKDPVSILDNRDGFISDNNQFGVYWEDEKPYLGTGGAEDYFD